MAVDFEYAQARVQARCGERLPASGWQLVETSRDLAQYLHAARGTVLAPRVQSFSAASSPHAIERSLRREWRRETDLAARWVPPRWRAAVAFTSWLVDLPALAWLARGEPVLPWMRDDTVLAPFAVEDVVLRHRELAAAGLDGVFGQDDALAAWRRRFESLWPAENAAGARLGDFVDTLASFRDRAGGAGLDAAAEGAARERLEARSVRLVRRSLGEPVTVFCHLLLVALDLARLRDGLLRRALFNDLAAA